MYFDCIFVTIRPPVFVCILAVYLSPATLPVFRLYNYHQQASCICLYFSCVYVTSRPPVFRLYICHQQTSCICLYFSCVFVTSRPPVFVCILAVYLSPAGLPDQIPLLRLLRLCLLKVDNNRPVTRANCHRYYSCIPRSATPSVNIYTDQKDKQQ